MPAQVKSRQPHLDPPRTGSGKMLTLTRRIVRSTPQKISGTHARMRLYTCIHVVVDVHSPVVVLTRSQMEIVI
jgi:hypothetical protein